MMRLITTILTLSQCLACVVLSAQDTAAATPSSVAELKAEHLALVAWRDSGVMSASLPPALRGWLEGRDTSNVAHWAQQGYSAMEGGSIAKADLLRMLATLEPHDVRHLTEVSTGGLRRWALNGAFHNIWAKVIINEYPPTANMVWALQRAMTWELPVMKRQLLIRSDGLEVVTAAMIEVPTQENKLLWGAYDSLQPSCAESVLQLNLGERARAMAVLPVTQEIRDGLATLLAARVNYEDYLNFVASPSDLQESVIRGLNLNRVILAALQGLDMTPTERQLCWEVLIPLRVFKKEMLPLIFIVEKDGYPVGAAPYYQNMERMRLRFGIDNADLWAQFFCNLAHIDLFSKFEPEILLYGASVLASVDDLALLPPQGVSVYVAAASRSDDSAVFADLTYQLLVQAPTTYLYEWALQLKGNAALEAGDFRGAITLLEGITLNGQPDAIPHREFYKLLLQAYYLAGDYVNAKETAWLFLNTIEPGEDVQAIYRLLEETSYGKNTVYTAKFFNRLQRVR